MPGQAVNCLIVLESEFGHAIIAGGDIPKITGVPERPVDFRAMRRTSYGVLHATCKFQNWKRWDLSSSVGAPWFFLSGLKCGPHDMQPFVVSPNCSKTGIPSVRTPSLAPEHEGT
jgi:hypothetical protein